MQILREKAAIIGERRKRSLSCCGERKGGERMRTGLS